MARNNSANLAVLKNRRVVGDVIVLVSFPLGQSISKLDEFRRLSILSLFFYMSLYLLRGGVNKRGR